MTRRNFMQSSAVAATAFQTTRAANDKIQIGFIGTGARGQELMQALLANPGVEITVLTDAYAGRMERAVARTNGRAKKVSDYKEILADKSVDGVVIATPDHWHKTMILEAFAAGKDVYCEKPMTYRSAEGLEIIEAQKRSGRVLQIGSQGMSGAIQRKAKEIIQSGKLGQVTMIRAAYNRNTASGAWIYPIPPDASPKTVNWDAFQGPLANKRAFNLERFFRWRCYTDYSGGIATDLFVHLCTTIHFLMDAKAPSKVMAMGQLYRWKESRDVPDNINALLEYPEGFAANLSSTFNNQSSAESSFQILGTKGTLAIGSDLTFFPETGVEDNRWIVESWPQPLENAYYRDPKVRQSEMPSTWKERAVEDRVSYRGEGMDSTVAHMGHYLESIRTRQPYWQNAAVGHRAAACAHMVNLSAQEGRLVQWDFAKDDIKA
jgi:predicted dehydrogenase